MHASIALAVISLGAATVTGALGYGYSSITVPLALLMIGSRTLNPALVVVEVAVNGYSAFLNRHAIRRIWARVMPVVIGVVPGIVVGAALLASLSSATVKVVCYGALLPLILAQAAGYRLPIRRERAVALPFGVTVGLLYSLTTISGPPLALFFNNQGLSREDFKVALAVTRICESGLTLATYAWLGLLTTETVQLSGWLAPGVLLGMPLGHALIARIAPDTFRRVCMSFDAWLVGFGLSRVIDELTVLPSLASYQILTLTIVVDAILLRRFFAARSQTSAR